MLASLARRVGPLPALARPLALASRGLTAPGLRRLSTTEPPLESPPAPPPATPAASWEGASNQEEVHGAAVGSRRTSQVRSAR